MCVEVSYANRTLDGTRIESIGGLNGGPSGDNSQWKLPVNDVIYMIDSGRWSFFVNVSTARPPDRVAVEPAGANRDYLRTETDGDTPNNLLALPQQARELPYSRPEFPANLPGAQEPEQLGILSGSQRTPLHQPDADSLYPVLPSKFVHVRLLAPFSPRFEISINGELPLYEASSDTGRLPDPLEDQGWFAVRSVGYVGRYDPQRPLELSRDGTVYELAIRLPTAVEGATLVVILIAQISLNPNCLPPQDKSTYLRLPLGRVAPVGTGPVATLPSQPSAGVERIRTWTQNQADQFSFSTRVTNPILDGARITTVKDVSRDINGNPSVDLENVRHTDAQGATIGPVFLERGGASGAFRGLLIQGEWSVRATNLSATLLDRRQIALEVGWNKA
jgi:hypothetical protein